MQLVNSSAARQVESAWKVRAALAPLIAFDMTAEPLPGPALDAHDARRRSGEAMVVDAL